MLAGCALAGAAFLALFLILDPYALLNLQRGPPAAQRPVRPGRVGKLGQDDVLGWVYYVGTLGWGLGWLPLAAAVGGAIVAIRRDWRRAALLLAFPVFLYLYMGAQGRYFGRWLLPAYPVLCVLAGYGAVALATALRRPALLSAVFAALLCAQGLLASVHVDRVLGREDTRTQALDWLRANVPGGERIVVEPFVPAEWAEEYEKWPVPRPFQAYEKRLRVRDIDRYREGGYCTVVVGSTQKERGLKAGLGSAERYYPALDDASAETMTFSPYGRARTPSSSPTTSRSTTRRARSSGRGRWWRSTGCRLPVRALPS